MVKENTYINIQAFMVNDLHLKGNELLIYAIIFGFSQDEESEFTGSLQYLADWTQSTKQGVMKALQSLCEKQLILKNVEYKNNIRFCTYKTSTVLNKVEQGIKQSLTGYETKFNGGIKQSLPNNINNTLDNTITNNIPKEKKHKLGTYLNVLLSDKELQKLIDELGQEKASAVIRNFSELKEMKGYKYKSDYLALKKWGIEAYEKRNQTSQNGGYVNNKRPASDNKVGEIDF
jgi:hypothetical protein